jgi:hypothetical protein
MNTPHSYQAVPVRLDADAPFWLGPRRIIKEALARWKGRSRGIRIMGKKINWWLLAIGGGVTLLTLGPIVGSAAIIIVLLLGVLVRVNALVAAKKDGDKAGGDGGGGSLIFGRVRLEHLYCRWAGGWTL